MRTLFIAAYADFFFKYSFVKHAFKCPSKFFASSIVTFLSKCALFGTCRMSTPNAPTKEKGKNMQWMHRQDELHLTYAVEATIEGLTVPGGTRKRDGTRC